MNRSQFAETCAAIAAQAEPEQIVRNLRDLERSLPLPERQLPRRERAKRNRWRRLIEARCARLAKARKPA